MKRTFWARVRRLHHPPDDPADVPLSAHILAESIHGAVAAAKPCIDTLRPARDGAGSTRSDRAGEAAVAGRTPATKSRARTKATGAEDRRDAIKRTSLACVRHHTAPPTRSPVRRRVTGAPTKEPWSEAPRPAVAGPSETERPGPAARSTARWGERGEAEGRLAQRAGPGARRPQGAALHAGDGSFGGSGTLTRPTKSPVL